MGSIYSALFELGNSLKSLGIPGPPHIHLDFEDRKSNAKFAEHLLTSSVFVKEADSFYGCGFYITIEGVK